MSCEGCVQQIKERNEAANKVLQDAQALANTERCWVGVYFDGYGVQQYEIYNVNTPYIRVLSPKL